MAEFVRHDGHELIWFEPSCLRHLHAAADGRCVAVYGFDTSLAGQRVFGDGWLADQPYGR